MASSKDLKSTIDKIVKYDIIKNNSNILKEFDDCKSKISTLDSNVSLIFQTYFNDVDNNIEGIHKSLGDAYSEFLSKYDFYTKVQPVVLNHIDKAINLSVDTNSFIKITDQYKKQYDDGDYEDTLVPTPPETYTSYDQFWAYNNNESKYISSVVTPIINELNDVNRAVNGAVTNINEWLNLGKNISMTCANVTSYINYKFGKSDLKYDRYELYSQKIEYIKPYSGGIYSDFKLAQSIIAKHPKFTHTYEFSDVLIDDIFSLTTMDSSMTSTTKKIEDFFTTYFK